MKIFILSLSFSLLVTFNSYAANDSLSVQYPANIGSYKELVLENPQSTPDCTNASNRGLSFMLNANNTLQICAMKNNANLAVPYTEQCFDRFYNATPPSPVCPPGYAQATSMADSFVPTSGVTVHSIVCCESSATVAVP